MIDHIHVCITKSIIIHIFFYYLYNSWLCNETYYISYILYEIYQMHEQELSQLYLNSKAYFFSYRWL